MRPVDHEAESCYSCGYSAIAAMAKYGENQVQMSRVHDAAHCLRKQDRDKLNEVLDSLELRFPQMLFCVYLGTLPEGLTISELGFWLLNHGQVKGAEYARPNDNAVMVIMDVNTKQVGLSLGYFAEMLMNEEEAYRVLMTARPYLVNGEYGSAMSQLFKRVGRVLSRKARKMKKFSLSQLQMRYRDKEKNVLDLPRHVSPRIFDSSQIERHVVEESVVAE